MLVAALPLLAAWPLGVLADAVRAETQYGGSGSGCRAIVDGTAYALRMTPGVLLAAAAVLAGAWAIRSSFAAAPHPAAWSAAPLLAVPIVVITPLVNSFLVVLLSIFGLIGAIALLARIGFAEAWRPHLLARACAAPWLAGVVGLVWATAGNGEIWTC